MAHLNASFSVTSSPVNSVRIRPLSYNLIASMLLLSLLCSPLIPTGVNLIVRPWHFTLLFSHYRVPPEAEGGYVRISWGTLCLESNWHPCPLSPLSLSTLLGSPASADGHHPVPPCFPGPSVPGTLDSSRPSPLATPDSSSHCQLHTKVKLRLWRWELCCLQEGRQERGPRAPSLAAAPVSL